MMLLLLLLWAIAATGAALWYRADRNLTREALEMACMDQNLLHQVYRDVSDGTR